MGELSKDELQLMIQVITRNTEQLSILTERNVQQASKIEVIQAQQEKTNARLYNGMAKEISDNVIKAVQACNQNCAGAHAQIANGVADSIQNLKKTITEDLRVGIKEDTTHAISESPIAKDSNFIKILVSCVTAVVVVAAVVITVIDSRQPPRTLQQKAVVAVEALTGK